MTADSLASLTETVRSESLDGALVVKNPSDNPVCSFTHDEDLSCIKVVWRKYATSAQLRFLHEALLQVMEGTGAQSLLGDDRELPIVHAEDQRWIIEEWLPRAQALGLKRVAAIPSHSFFGRLSIGSIQLILAKNVVVKQFQNVPLAADWLGRATHF